MKLTLQKLQRWATVRWKFRDPIFNRFGTIHPCDRRTDRRTGDSIYHISCHGCSQWWTPPLGLSFPRQSFGLSLRCLRRQLHWQKAPERIAFKQAVLVCKCLHVRTCIPYWQALSSGRCRGSSATSFQFIFIINAAPDFLLAVTEASFPCRRCTCLEQSARFCHFRTFCNSLLVPA